MKKNKIFLVVNLAMIAILAFSGCGGKSPENLSTGISDNSADDSYSFEEMVSSIITESKDVIENKTENVPILKDCVSKNLNCFVGCAATESELNDPKVWDIVTTHFNRITFGNELKPDALFNYSCTTVPGTETVNFNGEDMLVPIMNYDRAERMLDKVYDWNQSNPENEIKVRGHVLVWHSQTPEWFFHEDYDKKKPYVNKEEMNKRLEWYIATVLTHFTGEDSKYKDMFYGWDVVNEAISDATNTYRTDKENPNESLSEDRHGSNSSWWHIYESNEYIINAFKYANKYAPQELELYYNDYNDASFNKQQGIIELLKAVKEEEGEPGVGTRISAMGMQAHYSMDSPDANNITSAIKNYAKVVGHVQFTELDVTASSDYDGSDSMKESENELLRKRYNMIYFAISSVLNKEEVHFDGITFWGTVDHYSWLQSRSNVGGGSTTGLPQMPLLFSEDYEPKPCFYVFAKE